MTLSEFMEKSKRSISPTTVVMERAPGEYCVVNAKIAPHYPQYGWNVVHKGLPAKAPKGAKPSGEETADAKPARSTRRKTKPENKEA